MKYLRSLPKLRSNTKMRQQELYTAAEKIIL